MDANADAREHAHAVEIPLKSTGTILCRSSPRFPYRCLALLVVISLRSADNGRALFGYLLRCSVRRASFGRWRLEGAC